MPDSLSEPGAPGTPKRGKDVYTPPKPSEASYLLDEFDDLVQDITEASSGEEY